MHRKLFIVVLRDILLKTISPPIRADCLCFKKGTPAGRQAPPAAFSYLTMANKYVRRAKADSSYKKLAAARKKNRNRGTSTSDVNEASAEDNRRYGAELAQRLNEGESYESAKKSAAQAVDTGQDVGLSNQRAQEAFDKERQANMQSVQADLRRRTLQSYGVTTIGSGTATEPPLARKTGVSPGVTVPYANVRGYMPGQPATVSVNYREQPPARTSQLSQIEKARLGFYEPEQTGVLGRANVAFKTFTEKKRDTIRSALGLRPVTAEDTARGRVMFSPVAYAERVEQNPPTTRLGKAKAFAGGAARGSLEYVTYRPATTGAFAAAGAVVGSLAASAAAVGVKTAVATKLVGSAAIGFYGGSVAASTIKEPNWARKGTIVGTEAVKFGALYSGSMVGRNVRFTYDKIAVKTGEPTVTKTLTGYKVNVPQKVLYRGVGVAAGDKGTALVGRTSTGKVTVGNKVKLDFKGVKGSFIFETPGATKIGMYNVKRLGTPGTYGQLLNIQAVGDATRPVSQSQIDKLYSRQLPISTKTVTASGQRYVYADVRGRGKIIYGSAATSNLRATYPKGMKVYTKIPKRLAWKTPSDTDTVKWIARSTNVKQLNRLSTNLQRTGNTARVKKADAVLQTRSKGRWKTAVDSKDIVDIDTGFRSPDVPTSYSFGKRVDLGVIGQRSPFIGGGVKTITPREQLLLQLSSLQTLKVSGGKISLLNDASRSKDVFKAFQLSKAISKAGGTRV